MHLRDTLSTMRELDLVLMGQTPINTRPQYNTVKLPFSAGRTFHPVLILSPPLRYPSAPTSISSLSPSHPWPHPPEHYLIFSSLTSLLPQLSHLSFLLFFCWRVARAGGGRDAGMTPQVVALGACGGCQAPHREEAACCRTWSRRQMARGGHKPHAWSKRWAPGRGRHSRLPRPLAAWRLGISVKMCCDSVSDCVVHGDLSNF